MLQIMVPMKIRMKHMVLANRLLVDVTDSGHTKIGMKYKICVKFLSGYYDSPR